MSQLPDPTANLTGAPKKLFEELAARRGSVDGMYRTLLNHPDLTEHVSNLGTYLRFQSTLPGDIREFIILYSAHKLDAGYEWIKHVPPAKQAGLSDDIIEQIKAGQNTFSQPYAMFAQAADHALNLQSIPEKLQTSIVEKYTNKGVLELVILVGFYRMIAGVIFAFDVPLPPEHSIDEKKQH